MSQILPVRAVVMISMSSVLSVGALSLSEQAPPGERFRLDRNFWNLDNKNGSYFYCPKFEHADMPCQSKDRPCRIGAAETTQVGNTDGTTSFYPVRSIFYYGDSYANSKKLNKNVWDKALNSNCYDDVDLVKLQREMVTGRKLEFGDLEIMKGKYFYCPNFQEMPCQNRDEPCQIGRAVIVSAVNGPPDWRWIYKYGKRLPDQPRSNTVSEKLIEDTIWKNAMKAECYTIPNPFAMPTFEKLTKQLVTQKKGTQFYCPGPGADPVCSDLENPCQVTEVVFPDGATRLAEANSVTVKTKRGFFSDTYRRFSREQWDTNYMERCMKSGLGHEDLDDHNRIGKYFYCPNFVDSHMRCRSKEDYCRVGTAEGQKRWLHRLAGTSSEFQFLLEEQVWKEALESGCYDNNIDVESQHTKNLDIEVGEYFYCPDKAHASCQSKNEPCLMGKEETTGRWIHKFGGSEKLSEKFITNETLSQIRSDCARIDRPFPMPTFDELKEGTQFHCPEPDAVSTDFISDLKYPFQVMSRPMDDSVSILWPQKPGQDSNLHIHLSNYIPLAETNFSRERVSGHRKIAVVSRSDWDKKYGASCMSSEQYQQIPKQMLT